MSARLLIVRLLAFLATLLPLTGLAVADKDLPEGKFLNVAILELPDRFIADMPKKERGDFLIFLSSENDNRMLDYAHGWLCFFSDSAYLKIHASSMFYIKLLPRKDDTPLVFIYATRAFIMEKVGNEWKDVTKRVVPRNVDLTAAFNPLRTRNVIEVSGTRHHPGLDMIWENGLFRVAKTHRTEFSDDDLIFHGR